MSNTATEQKQIRRGEPLAYVVLRYNSGIPMNLHAVWAYFALLTVVMAMAALPVFRFIDSPPDSGIRYSALDGLRGFLSLTVFVFHFVLYLLTIL